jgi:AraC-like DNA-binding protein
MIIRPHQRRRVVFEKIPLDASASFAFLEFRPRYYKFCWHYHPEIEIGHVVRGHGIRFVGDSVRDFVDGDLVLLGANLPHTWHTTVIPKRPLHSMVIQFLPECLGERFFELPEMRKVKELFARSKRGLLFKGKTRQLAADRLMQMRRERVGSLQHMQAFLYILTLMAESSECEPLAVAGYEPVLNQEANRKINQILGEVNASVEDPPAQSDAARSLRLSPQAFSRFFKRCLGKTYVEYVNELRIGKVCRSLLESNGSVTQIAYDAGFNNLSNFNECFKRIKKMTPSQYRKLTHVKWEPEFPPALPRRR